MKPDSSEHLGQVRDFFDAQVAAYDAFYDPPSALGRWFNRVFRKAVYLRRNQTIELARRYNCETVLDVGCGSGRNSIWFARNGIQRVYGVDISQEMIGEARVLAKEAGVEQQCEFEHLDFWDLKPGPRFDLVAALGVFDYVQNAAPFLEHMAQFADKVVYGSFPGWTLLRTPLRKVRYWLQGCPTHFYRRREVKELLSDLNFGSVGIKPVPSGHLAWVAKEAAESTSD